MEIKILGHNHSILDQYLAEIRDINIQTDPLRFRDDLNRTGELFAYEISKEIEFEYMASPSLDNKLLILSNPMLALGEKIDLK